MTYQEYSRFNPLLVKYVKRIRPWINNYLRLNPFWGKDTSRSFLKDEILKFGLTSEMGRDLLYMSGYYQNIKDRDDAVNFVGADFTEIFAMSKIIKLDTGCIVKETPESLALYISILAATEILYENTLSVCKIRL